VLPSKRTCPQAWIDLSLRRTALGQRKQRDREALSSKPLLELVAAVEVSTESLVYFAEALEGPSILAKLRWVFVRQCCAEVRNISQQLLHALVHLSERVTLPQVGFAH